MAFGVEIGIFRKAEVCTPVLTDLEVGMNIGTPLLWNVPCERFIAESSKWRSQFTIPFKVRKTHIAVQLC